jgi:hypothetical protein
MEALEMNEKNINLGKTIVKELERDSGIDTLSRWMAHYVAEQISIAESSQGKKKNEAEKYCFETILKLWRHRAYYPRGHKPFENYEIVFRALERLDPENEKPYFYSNSYPLESNDGSLISDETKKWLEAAFEIDRTARIWIEYILNQAMESASDEKTKEWLLNAIDFPNQNDISIIIKYVNPNEESNDSEKETKDLCNQLRSRIKTLNSFNKLNKLLLKAYKNELQSIENK